MKKQLWNYSYDISPSVVTILSIQIGLWGAMVMESMGYGIPLLRQIIGFLYLTFIPGYVILRIFKMNNIHITEIILYSVGLSISFLMFIGLIINTCFPLLNIVEPLSETILTITIGIVVTILSGLCYKNDNNVPVLRLSNIKKMLSPILLIMCLIPLISIFGTYLVNYYGINIILMILIVIVSIIWLLIGFDKLIPRELYCLTIFIVSISLLYHTTLISNYLLGADIHGEYYFSNLVKETSYWNSSIYRNVNAMLSIVMLPPIYSKILKLDIVWIYKIIYPFLFSLVPVGLYKVFEKYTNSKTAALSSLFFMSSFIFYGAMSELPRQQIAELFVVLSLLLMVDDKMKTVIKRILLIIFSFSIIVSHYGLSYIYLFMLINTWIILEISKNSKIKEISNKYYSIIYKGMTDFPINVSIKNEKNSALSLNLVLLFIIFTVTWYINTSSSSPFNTIVNIADHIYLSIVTDFFNVKTTSLEYVLTKIPSISQTVTRYLYIITQFLIVIGILTYKNMNFKEYHALSLTAIIMLVVSAIVSHVASAMGFLRLYFTFLTFLAPFSILGGIYLLYRAIIFNKFAFSTNYVKTSYRLLSIFFMLYFIFNSGLAAEILNEKSTSVSLNKTIDYAIYSDYDFYGSTWLSNRMSNSAIIYADNNGYPYLLERISLDNVRVLFAETDNVNTDSYIYLREYNIKNNQILGIGEEYHYEYYNLDKTVLYNKVITRKSELYDNGGAIIYYSKN